MICPKCKGENCTIISETNSQGYDFLNGCCCYMILGPLGLLCGACGMGSTSTNYWVCNDCGNKFQLNDKQVEKVSDEIKLKREIESYPLNLKFSMDLNNEEIEKSNIVIKKFIERFINNFDELSDITQKRIIYSMPNENSDDELRIKKIIYDSIGSNRNFIANNETILFAYDSSNELNGENGFIITEKNVYSKDRFNNVKSKMIKENSLIEKNSHNGLMNNGLPMRLNSKTGKDADILLDLLIKSFKNNNVSEVNEINLGIEQHGVNNTLKGYVLDYNSEIYYCDKENGKDYAIYRIEENKKPVQIYSSKNEIRNLEIVNNILYFIEDKILQGSDVRFIKLQDKQNGILKNKVKKTVKIINEKVYYSINKGELICLDLRTRNEAVISREIKGKFSIWNDNIYYINKYDSTLFKMKTDGTETQRIYAGNIGNVEEIIEDNENVYYIKNDSIYKINGDISVEILRCKKIEQAVVKNDYIIFIAKKIEFLINSKTIGDFEDEDSALFIAHIKDGWVKVLTYESCKNFHVLNNKIFLKANNMQDLCINFNYGISCIINPNNMKKVYLKDGIL